MLSGLSSRAILDGLGQVCRLDLATPPRSSPAFRAIVRTNFRMQATPEELPRKTLCVFPCQARALMMNQEFASANRLS